MTTNKVIILSVVFLGFIAIAEGKFLRQRCNFFCSCVQSWNFLTLLFLCSHESEKFGSGAALPLHSDREQTHRPPHSEDWDDCSQLSLWRNRDHVSPKTFTLALLSQVFFFYGAQKTIFGRRFSCFWCFFVAVPLWRQARRFAWTQRLPG